MLNRFLYTILFCLVTTVSFCQQFQTRDFIPYQTKDGLSNNNIWALAQDNFGYIWIGSKKGLNRFDGTNFLQFYSDTSLKSLPEDWAHFLKWIDKEVLGVATLSGLHLINTRTLEKRNLFIPADTLKNFARVNRVFDVSSDKKGNIFLITTTGFYHFSKDRLVFRHDHFSRKYIESKGGQFGWKMAFANEQELLLSAMEGLYVYDIEKKDLHPLGEKDDPFYHTIAMPKERCFFLYHDDHFLATMLPERNELAMVDLKGKTKRLINTRFNLLEQFSGSVVLLPINDTTMLLTGGHAGVYTIYFDRQSNSWNLGPKPFLENDFCMALMLDKNNHVWIGANDGLYRQKKIASAIELTQLPPEGNPLEKTISTFMIADNKIFVGTSLNGLYVFDGYSMSFLKHISWHERRVNHVRQILAINQDSLLLGSNGSVVNSKNLGVRPIDLEKELHLNKVNSFILRDSRNFLYATKNQNDTILIQRPGERYFTQLKLEGLGQIRSVTKLAEDPEGNIWFGGEGLVRWNYRTKKIDIFLDSFPAIKIHQKVITGNIVFDNNGRMYFGVTRNGLIIYDLNKKNFSSLTRLDGLPDNDIRSLYLHDDGMLWIGTDNGLASYDTHTKKISAFGASDGIPVDPNTCQALFYDKENQLLYAAFTHTIARFYPGRLKKNELPPAFFVGSIDITGKGPLYHPNENIIVSYKNNSVVVHLSSINFEDPTQQQFAYRVVKNGNEPWQETGQQRSIFFNNLPTGENKLQVKVYIRNQSWPEQIREIILTVRPPFWKTAGFYIAIAVLTTASLFYVHRRRVHKITQKANIDRQLSEMEMKGLHAQMNPHFIFNCLNSIREMILNNDNRDASHYLSKFAQLIRITLDQSTRSFVSLKNTIDYLERYLEMERIRNSLFRYEIKVDDHLQPDEVMIPPMLIQPFLENSIWHGGRPGKELSITVYFTKEDDKLVCTIEDNGVGIESSMKMKSEVQIDHNPIGIANVKERIQVLNEKYNLHSKITIDDKSVLNGGTESGTRVKLFLQLNSVVL
jgi:ligand-binding sensor domain-containing protein